MIPPSEISHSRQLLLLIVIYSLSLSSVIIFEFVKLLTSSLTGKKYYLSHDIIRSHLQTIASSSSAMQSLDDMNIQWLPPLRYGATAQWPAWSAQMKGALVFMGTWSVVVPPSSDESSESSSNRNTGSMVRDAQYLIKSHTDHTLHSHLTGPDGRDKAPHEMWEALKNMFESRDTVVLFNQLENLMMHEGRMDEREPLEPQMDAIIYRMHKLRKNGLKLDDRMQAFLLLSKLPETYQSVVSDILRTVEAKDLSVETIFPKIVLEESIHKIWKGNDESKKSDPIKNQPRKTGPCGYCGSRTHHESNCWYKDPSKKPKRGES